MRPLRVNYKDTLANSYLDLHYNTQLKLRLFNKLEISNLTYSNFISHSRSTDSQNLPKLKYSHVIAEKAVQYQIMTP